MTKNIFYLIQKLGMIVLGNLLYTLAVTLFIVPNGLLTGGFSFIDLLLKRYL